MNYLFESERLGFRTWEDIDAKPFTAINSDDQVVKYLPGKRNLEQTKEFISRIKAHFDKHGYGLYAAELLEGREFIGYIGFQHFDFDVPFSPGLEIGWRLTPHTWGQGLATEGAMACLKHGWRQLGLTKVYSFAAQGNIKSERVMQKIGMTKQGEFEHPKLEKGHRLKRHVLYSIDKPASKKGAIPDDLVI